MSAVERCLVPEKKAVTEAEEFTLDPPWRAAWFTVIHEQVVKMSAHGAGELLETGALKMAAEWKITEETESQNQQPSQHISFQTSENERFKRWVRFHPFPLGRRVEVWELHTEDSFYELASDAAEVEADGVTQHTVEGVRVQQHRHIVSSNTNLTRHDYSGSNSKTGRN